MNEMGKNMKKHNLAKQHSKRYINKHYFLKNGAKRIETVLKNKAQNTIHNVLIIGKQIGIEGDFRW